MAHPSYFVRQLVWHESNQAGYAVSVYGDDQVIMRMDDVLAYGGWIKRGKIVQLAIDDDDDGPRNHALDTYFKHLLYMPDVSLALQFTVLADTHEMNVTDVYGEMVATQTGCPGLKLKDEPEFRDFTVDYHTIRLAAQVADCPSIVKPRVFQVPGWTVIRMDIARLCIKDQPDIIGKVRKRAEAFGAFPVRRRCSMPGYEWPINSDFTVNGRKFIFIDWTWGGHGLFDDYYCENGVPAKGVDFGDGCIRYVFAKEVE